MFIETLEFTIPIDLCVVFSALQKGPKANLEFPASVSSYGTTQDASIQVLVKSNKLTFKVDGVSSESSIIAKSDCRTLKLAVFDVDRSLIPVETPSPVPVTAKRSYEEVTSKRNHDDSVSNPKSLKSSRTFSDNVGPDNQFRNISQNNSATTPLSSKPPPPPPPPPSVPQRMPQRNNAESNSVQVKVEPEDPDLIEIDEDEAEGLEPKTEIPYMQEHYASSSPQIPPDRVSFPSSSSSFQQNVQHVQPNYAEAGTSHQGEQSADDYLVYQDDVDYSDNDNSADYTNEDKVVQEVDSIDDVRKQIHNSNGAGIPDQSGSANTNRANRTVCRLFKSYLRDNGIDPNFEYFNIPQLNNALTGFYSGLRTKSGERYKVTSFRSIRHGLNRYLRSVPNNRDIDIVRDHAFYKANMAFKAARGEMEAMGNVSTKAYSDVIVKEACWQIYSSPYLDPETPGGLANKVQFDIRMYFMIRQNESFNRMTKDTFRVLQSEETGLRFVVRSNGPQNCPLMPEQPGSPMCPVVSYMKYISKLHPHCELLWQVPVGAARIFDPVWFLDRPIAKNVLETFSTRLSEVCQLQRKYTSNCIRSTAIFFLMHSDMNAVKVKNVVGYNKPSSALHLSVQPVVSILDKMRMGWVISRALQKH